MTTKITTQEAKGAITIRGKWYKLVSFADDKAMATLFSNAYKKAGYKTAIRKAKGNGYAVYAQPK